jgi:glycosyltransferase involved in cell wall biosynthesis
MNTENRFEVSVLLVTYNHAEYVRQALDSVIMQKTDFDVEIVVADDYSLDSTLEIIKEYQADYPNIRILPTEKRVGITLNYKRGFDACRGRYIAMLEGDDFWISPRKLELLVTFLEEHPECPFCFHRIIRLDEASDRAGVYPTFPDKSESRLFTASQLASRNFIENFSTCVYRREAIAKLEPGLWSLKLREWPFNIVVAQQGLVGYVPSIMSVYRGHPGGIWSQKTPEEQSASILELIEAYNKFLGFRFDAEFQSFKNFLLAESLPSPAYRRFGRRLKPFVPPILVSLAKNIFGAGQRPPS